MAKRKREAMTFVVVKPGHVVRFGEPSAMRGAGTILYVPEAMAQELIEAGHVKSAFSDED